MTFDNNWRRVQQEPERGVWLFPLAEEDGLRNDLHSIDWTATLATNAAMMRGHIGGKRYRQNCRQIHTKEDQRCQVNS